MQFETKNYETIIFRYVIGVCTFALLATIGLYAYLGTFSRYLGDDYCEAMLFKDDSPIGAVVKRYTEGNWPRATMRYSNLLFVGFSELPEKNNMPITMVSMNFLWVAGLTYAIRETRKSLKTDWGLEVDSFLALLLAFFSFLLAPNLFQTVYWRSAMMTHFAPLVFGSFLFGFLAKQFRRAESRAIPPVIFAGVFFAAFIIAGFSEPPTTTMLTALPLFMIAVWIWGKSPVRNKRLALFGVVFLGVMLGLVVMLFSPASANAAQEKKLDIAAVLFNSFHYSYLFMVDSLGGLPLPFSVSMFIPFLLFWLYPQEKPFLSNRQKRPILLIMFALPLITWLLIAAGFSPSAYGQGFPVERMRFLARVITIAAFMLEGSLLGLLLKTLPFKRGKTFIFRIILTIFTTVSVVYPIRAAYNIYKYEVPAYRERAQLWDARNAQIHALLAQGQTDLVVAQFDGVDGVKELDVNANHWVNRCAAKYYGFNSIRALPEKDLP
jgi:hypothetical protein